MFASRYVAVAGLSLCAAGAARAGFTFGEPITILTDGTTANITFVTARATWTGILFMNNPALPASMGTALFQNQSARAGDTRALGVFFADDSITFNYRVLTGSRVDWRMASAPEHFGLEMLDSRTVAVHIEDMPMTISDLDYDDCVAIVRFSADVRLGRGGGGDENPAPTPGTAALVATGVALGLSRRRR